MSPKKLAQKIREYYRHKNELQDLVRNTRQMLENVNIQKVFSYGESFHIHVHIHITLFVFIEDKLIQFN